MVGNTDIPMSVKLNEGQKCWGKKHNNFCYTKQTMYSTSCNLYSNSPTIGANVFNVYHIFSNRNASHRLEFYIAKYFPCF